MMLLMSSKYVILLTQSSSHLVFNFVDIQERQAGNQVEKRKGKQAGLEDINGSALPPSSVLEEKGQVMLIGTQQLVGFSSQAGTCEAELSGEEAGSKNTNPFSSALYSFK